MMKIEKQITDKTILQELGQRLAHRRVELGITQSEVAEQAGVGKRTIERIEAGGDIQFTTLIRLLRVLDLFDNLEQLVPEISISPMKLLKLKGRQRQRASSKKATKLSKSWHWGDER